MVSWVKTSTFCILVETKINFELQALTVTCCVLYPSCLLLLWTKCFLDESFYCSSCKDVILIFHWFRLWSTMKLDSCFCGSCMWWCLCVLWIWNIILKHLVNDWWLFLTVQSKQQMIHNSLHTQWAAEWRRHRASGSFSIGSSEWNTQDVEWEHLFWGTECWM